MQMPSRQSPAPAGPLAGRGLRDRLDRQPLHLGPPAVARDPRRAGVDRRSGCRARSATSRRRWWPARCGGRCAARTPSAARPWAAGRRAAAPRCCAASRPRSASAVSRISRSPDRNTSTSPGRQFDASMIARLARPATMRVGLGRLIRPRARAGGSGSRPDRCGRTPRRSGAPPKCAANRCGSIVAAVTITFRSGRRGSSSVR